MHPHAILETALYVDDLDAAERFYTEVLGLEIFAKMPGRHTFFRCGHGMFLLFDPKATLDPQHNTGTVVFAPHGTSGPGHMAFAMHETEAPAWRARLAEKGVAIEQEVEWPNGGLSIYFRDPAGNSIELATPRLWGL